MKVNLIVAGGALIAAFGVAGMAAPVSADSTKCDLSVGDSTNTLGIDRWGVYAGRRDAKACKKKDDHRHHHHWNRNDAYDDDDYDDADYGDADYGHPYGPPWGGYPGSWFGR
ncbi:MAG TPA: hypothetical protein VFV66_30795 [Nonomuraea sp.]|nr:hypothetical protein [Nonomuraea sp.]